VLQVGYISEYPHTTTAGTAAAGVDGAAAAAVSGGGSSGGNGGKSGSGGIPLEELFWRGGVEELEGGRRCVGKVWPSVRAFETEWGGCGWMCLCMCCSGQTS
jgi:hypothetical protein